MRPISLSILLILMMSCVRSATREKPQAAPNQESSSPRVWSDESNQPADPVVAELKELGKWAEINKDYLETGKGEPTKFDSKQSLPSSPDQMANAQQQADASKSADSMGEKLQRTFDEAKADKLPSRDLCPVIGNLSCSILIASGVYVVARVSWWALSHAIVHKARLATKLIIPATIEAAPLAMRKPSGELDLDQAFMIAAVTDFTPSYLQPRRLIIFYPGNAEIPSGERLNDVARSFADGAPVRVVGLSYPSGLWTAREMTDYFEQITRKVILESGVSPKNVVLVGWSMGGAMATYSAAALWRDPATSGVGLVTDRTFSRLGKVVDGILGRTKVLFGGMAQTFIDTWGDLRPPFWEIPESKQLHIYAAADNDVIIGDAHTKNYIPSFADGNRFVELPQHTHGMGGAWRDAALRYGSLAKAVRAGEEIDATAPKPKELPPPGISPLRVVAGVGAIAALSGIIYAIIKNQESGGANLTKQGTGFSCTFREVQKSQILTWCLSYPRIAAAATPTYLERCRAFGMGEAGVWKRGSSCPASSQLCIQSPTDGSSLYAVDRAAKQQCSAF